jgi:hypothetical protein
MKALHVADFLTDRPMAQEKAVGSVLVLISKLVDSFVEIIIKLKLSYNINIQKVILKAFHIHLVRLSI